MTNTQKTNFKQAKKQYNRIKAEHERVKAIDEQSKIKVLTENQFYSEPLDLEDGRIIPSERITESNSDFTMSETDFIAYCKLVYAENIKAGLDTPDHETTVDYKIRKELKQAEENLLTAGFDIIPNSLKSERMTLEEARDHWKYRDKMLNLVQRLSF